MDTPEDCFGQTEFNFDNVQRNAFLQSQGFKMPTPIKTGTTICGIIFEDGIVLGADTRATEGPIVCDKNCEKIHHIASNIYCCGAGTAADTENTTGLISSQLDLHRLAVRRESRVITALTMLKQLLFRYQGYVSAALVLGGVDFTGPHLHTVYPHGSTDNLPFVTMGSGSLAAMAVFEQGWKQNMKRQDAIDLVHEAVKSGIFNDLGSGSNVDIVVITKGKTDIYRNYDKPNSRKYISKRGYNFPKHTTPVLKTEIVPISQLPVIVEKVPPEAMDES